MIFYDRVGIVLKAKETSTGPIVEIFNGTVPAIVVPMESAKIIDNGGTVQYTRYQLLIKPFERLIPLASHSSVPNQFGTTQVLFSYGGHTSLTLEGKVERHLLRGRLHHYEVIVRT